MILKRSPFKKPKRSINWKRIVIILLVIFALPLGYIAGITVKKMTSGISLSIINNKTNSGANEKQTINTQDEIKVEKEIRAVYLPKKELTPEGINSFLDYAKENDINSVVIDLKGTDGFLIYESTNEMAKTIGAVSKEPVGLKSIITKLKDSGIYTIARLKCFRDNTAASIDKSLAVQINGGGYWWHYEKWLNAYKKGAWDYLVSIGAEAADLGFDEIMLDEVKFPDEGKLNLISYFEDASTPKPQAINGFVNYITDILHEKNVKVSLSTPPQAAYADGTADSGQSFDYLNLRIDYLAPHFEPASFRIKRGAKVTVADKTFDTPEKNPGEIITVAMNETLKKLNSTNIKIRPFLQCYPSNGVTFDKTNVNIQIDAVKTSGGLGYILYNEQGNIN